MDIPAVLISHNQSGEVIILETIFTVAGICLAAIGWSITAGMIVCTCWRKLKGNKTTSPAFPKEEGTSEPMEIKYRREFEEFVQDFKLSETEIQEIENNKKFKDHLYCMLCKRGTAPANEHIWHNVYRPFFYDRTSQIYTGAG